MATYDNGSCRYGLNNNYFGSISNSPSIVSHYSGQKICSNSTIYIQAMAIDHEAIQKVEFYIDDILIYIDSEKPYMVDWDCSSYDNGSHSLKVISYNLSGESKYDSINLIIDDMPSIDINTPNWSNSSDGYWEYIPIRVNTKSCIGITDLTFYINDTLVQASSNYGVSSVLPFSGLCSLCWPKYNNPLPIYYLSLPSSHFTDSSYAINVTAQDLNGNIAESNTVEVMNCRFSESPNPNYQCHSQCMSNCLSLCSYCDPDCGCPNTNLIGWYCYIESEIIEEFEECFYYEMNNDNYACPMVVCCDRCPDDFFEECHMQCEDDVFGGGGN